MTATTTTTAAAAVVLILPLVLATCGHAKLTDDAERINNYGSCPLVKAKYSEDDWFFNTQLRGYTSTEMQEMLDCNEPFPDANIYHKDETVIATYFDNSFNRTWEDGTKSAPCPLNLTYLTSSDFSLSSLKLSIAAVVVVVVVDRNPKTILTGEIEGRYQSERTCEMTIMEPSGAAARQSKGAGVVRDFTLDNYALRLMEKKGGDEDFDEWLAIFETMVEIWEGLPDDFEFCAPSPSRASEFDSDTELWPVLGTEGEENGDGVLHENREG